jgi:hypothetical protein
MNLWMAATVAAVSAAPIALGALAGDPQSQDSGNVTTSVSYTQVVYSTGSGTSQVASTGASYGRIEEVGASISFYDALSLGSAAYMALGGTIVVDLDDPASFQLLQPAPNAGFAFTEVAVPVSDGMSGSMTVRFDGVVAALQASANPDLLKVLAPAHTTGTVDVTVESANKTVAFESGFAYVPALYAPAETGLGQHVQLRVFGSPGSMFWVFYSESLGTPASVPGVDGSLDIDLGTMLALGMVTIPVELAGGATTREGFLEFDIPKNPELAGKTFFVQAATYDPTLPNTPYAFTNHTAVSVKN